MARKNAPKKTHSSSTNLLLMIGIAATVVLTVFLAANVVNSRNTAYTKASEGEVAAAETTNTSKSIQGILRTINPCKINKVTGTKLCYSIKDASSIETYLQSSTYQIELALQNNTRINNVAVSGILVKRGGDDYLVISSISIPNISIIPSPPPQRSARNWGAIHPLPNHSFLNVFIHPICHFPLQTHPTTTYYFPKLNLWMKQIYRLITYSITSEDKPKYNT